MSKKNAEALRLQKLRAATKKTWNIIAADLGIKPAMVFHVLAGNRSFSEKTRQRLLACEAAAGIRTQASVMIEQKLRGGDLVSALLAGQVGVAVNDIDAGFKEVQLEYRRGNAPDGYPKKLKVKAARNSDLWQAIGIMGATDRQEKLLEACLENLKSTPDLLERLTPECYGKIIHCAFDLTFGLNWREKLQPATD